MAPFDLFILGLFMFLIHFSYSDPASDCTRTNASLLNFTSHFTMAQHQLRGLFSIIDGCSFRVSEFDMVPGVDVHWWGAGGVDLHNFTNGFPISHFALNQTYKYDSFTVRLRKNVTWDQIKVLAVWDTPTASDFGHVLLNNFSANDEAGFSDGEQPTVFENCKALADNYRIRWSRRKGDGGLILVLRLQLEFRIIWHLGGQTLLLQVHIW